MRIALNLKGIPFEYAAVHLVKNEQLAPEFKALNPEALVPVLADDDWSVTQSLAICEYLDETVPEPPLLPLDPVARSQVRALALLIACEIHPLNNLRVLRYLVHELGISEESKDGWYRHWVESGLASLEAQLVHHALPGPFCYGVRPTLADVCLVPQVFNAQRFKCNLGGLSRVMTAYEACMELEPFQKAAPACQPDAA